MNTIIFSEAFLSEIKSLALQIAKKQRNESHMQPIETLNRKFLTEQKELSEASEQWDELPDVCYYLACMFIVRDELLSHSFVWDWDDDRDYGQELWEFEQQREDAKKYASEGEVWLSQEIEKRGVTVAQLEAGTLAKYRLRAVQEKNVDLERADILKAVAN